MAVQKISKKRIIKHDLDNPNFKKPPKPEPEAVNGNSVENETKGVFRGDVYGEKMESMMNKICLVKVYA